MSSLRIERRIVDAMLGEPLITEGRARQGLPPRRDVAGVLGEWARQRFGHRARTMTRPSRARKHRGGR